MSKSLYELVQAAKETMDGASFPNYPPNDNSLLRVLCWALEEASGHYEDHRVEMDRVLCWALEEASGHYEDHRVEMDIVKNELQAIIDEKLGWGHVFKR